MKKTIKYVSIGSTICLVAVIVANSKFFNLNHQSMFGVSADGCNHVGYHYEANSFSATKDGNKEFWVCCKCHNQYLENPGSGKWTTQSFDKAAFDKSYDPKGIYLRARASVTRNFDFNVSEAFSGNTEFTDATNSYVYSSTGYASTLSVKNNDYHYKLDSVSAKVGDTTISSAYNSETGKLTLSNTQITDNITLNAKLVDKSVGFTYEQGKRINSSRTYVTTDVTGMCVSKTGILIEKGKTYYLKNMTINPDGYSSQCAFIVAKNGDGTNFINVHNGSTFKNNTDILGGTDYDGTCYLVKNYDEKGNVIAVTVKSDSSYTGNLYLYFNFVNVNPSVHKPGVYIADSYDTNYSKITLNCDNCSVGYDHDYVCNGNIFETTVTIPSNSHFESATATVGGVSKTVNYDDATGKLYIEGAITGAVVLNVKAKLNAFDVTHSTTSHIKFTGDSSALPGSTYTAKIESTDYKFKPTNVTVKMNGQTVSNAYNEATGAITVNNVSGNISISYSETDSAKLLSYQTNKRISGLSIVDCTSPAGMCVSEGVLLEKGKTYEFVNMNINTDLYSNFTGFATTTTSGSSTFMEKHTGTTINTTTMGSGVHQVIYELFKNGNDVTAVKILENSAFTANIYMYFVFNNTNPTVNKPAIYIY